MMLQVSHENRGTCGVRSPDEHSNKSRTTSGLSGSSCAVWVSSGGTGFPTIYCAVAARNSGRWGGQGGRCRPGPVTLVAGQSISAM